MTVLTLKGLHRSCKSECVVNSCRSSSCRVVLPSGSECIDCDECPCFPLAPKFFEESFIEETEKFPGFIVICYESNEKQSSWVIVDFKGNVSHIGEIIRQLQVGAIAVEKHPKFRINNSPNNLVALIVKEGGFKHASELDRRSIKFRNSLKQVFVKKRGFRVKELLRDKE